MRDLTTTKLTGYETYSDDELIEEATRLKRNFKKLLEEANNRRLKAESVISVIKSEDIEIDPDSIL